MEIINGRCYERSIIYNTLVSRNYKDPFTNQEVSNDIIMKMKNALTKSQQKLIEDINALPNYIYNTLYNVVYYLFAGFHAKNFRVSKEYIPLDLRLSHNIIMLLITCFFFINIIKYITYTYKNGKNIRVHIVDFLEGRRRFIEWDQ